MWTRSLESVLDQESLGCRCRVPPALGRDASSVPFWPCLRRRRRHSLGQGAVQQHNLHFPACIGERRDFVRLEYFWTHNRVSR